MLKIKMAKIDFFSKKKQIDIFKKNLPSSLIDFVAIMVSEIFMQSMVKVRSPVYLCNDIIKID